MREVGIESSGHLSFHLGKLDHILKVTPEGAYKLTDDGREALHLAEVMVQTDSPSIAANSIQSGRETRKGSNWFAKRPRRKKMLIPVSVALIIAIRTISMKATNARRAREEYPSTGLGRYLRVHGYRPLKEKRIWPGGLPHLSLVKKQMEDEFDLATLNRKIFREK